MKKRRSRGGRPKNAPRPKYDLGTEELLRKRMTIGAGDPMLSTCPLDVLLARRLISEEAHGAANYFAALRKMVFGKAIPPAFDLLAVSGPPVELDSAKAEGKYRDACAVLSAQGRGPLNAVENLVVHEHWPVWLFTRGPRSAERRRLETGLAALVTWYRGERRANARTAAE